MKRMPKNVVSKFALTLIAIGLSNGCSSETASVDSIPDSAPTAVNNAPEQDLAPEENQVVVNDPEFHEDLIAAADDYLGFGLVDTRIHVAPTDCAAPAMPGSDVPQPAMSSSDHDSTHGKKLYFLFAKEIAHYLNQDGSDSPVGQTVVKESWTSKTANPDARNLRAHACGIRVNPRVDVGHEMLEIGKRKNLFVMLKLATDTPETDAGWIYGVVTPDTKEVLSSGKVPSCMKCHTEATHDRLFGPALSASAADSSDADDSNVNGS